MRLGRSCGARCVDPNALSHPHLPAGGWLSIDLVRAQPDAPLEDLTPGAPGPIDLDAELRAQVDGVRVRGDEREMARVERGSDPQLPEPAIGPVGRQQLEIRRTLQDDDRTAVEFELDQP